MSDYRLGEESNHKLWLTISPKLFEFQPVSMDIGKSIYLFGRAAM